MTEYYDANKPEIIQNNIILHWIGRIGLRLLGWKIKGRLPFVPKMIVIAAPHTSNMDGLIIFLTIWAVRLKVNWMVKKEWVDRPIIGAFLKANGAIGVDRSGSHQMVQQMANEFNQREHMVLAIPPEGTRRKTDHWKAGFYWIAVEADVPILPVVANFKEKTVDLNAPLFDHTGDIEADIEHIWSYYGPSMARYPEKMSDKRLRPSAMRRQETNSETESSPD